MRLMRSPQGRRRDSRGQAMVEFTMVFMIFMTIVVALMEFSFLLTTKVGVTNTAQDAVQLASQLGNTASSDFQILQLVEKDISAPMDKAKIVSVEIFKTDSYGTKNLGEDKYTRDGGLYHNPSNTLQTVPYTQSTPTYAPSTRQNVVATGVDYIGVIVTYQYTWITPIPNLVSLGSTGIKFVQSSVSRMEPIQ
jgi:Flp pilus assembly protein TadG